MGNKSVFVPSTTPLLDSNNMSQIHVTRMTLRLCLNHPFYALAMGLFSSDFVCQACPCLVAFLDRVGVHWYRDRALLFCDSARGPPLVLDPGFKIVYE
jgi:hypothetical protein